MHSWPILAQLLPDIHLRLHLGHLYSPKHRFLPWYGVRPSPFGRACENYVDPFKDVLSKITFFRISLKFAPCVNLRGYYSVTPEKGAIFNEFLFKKYCMHWYKLFFSEKYTLRE